MAAAPRQTTSESYVIKAIFVCSGNICRSPMAAAQFKVACKSRGVPATIISMGTLGLNARPAAAEAIEAMDELGIDISGHRSQGISAGILAMATHIFVMEQKHADMIRRVQPGAAPRTLLLGSYENPDVPEVEDPVNQSIVEFRACRDRMQTAIDNFLNRYQSLR